jgi:hypothetical protein
MASFIVLNRTIYFIILQDYHLVVGQVHDFLISYLKVYIGLPSQIIILVLVFTWMIFQVLIGQLECGERTMALLSLVFDKLNIPLSANKTVGPTCVLEYIGIILDTVNMQARFAEGKIVRITGFIHTILNKPSCIKKELAQLLYR